MRFFLLIFIFLLLSLNASGRYFSAAPIPATELLDVNIQKCDKACFDEYKKKEKFFSLAARSAFNDKTTAYYQNLINYNSHKDELKIAILIPSKVIGRYSIYVANAVSSYLLSTEKPFKIKTFDSTDESMQNLDAAIKKIVEEGFDYCIAPVTTEGANNLALVNSSLNIFIPTVNNRSVDNDNYLIVYGGIDYNAQIDELDSMFKKELFIFDESGPVSKSISEYVSQNDKLPITQLTIKNHVVKYSSIFESIKFKDGSTALLNTQPIKSSLLLSQFSYNDVNLSAVLSTQINYNPILLALTQSNDLKKFYVANSITTKNSKIEEYNNLLHNDIVYNWINYSTSVLCDFIFQSINGDYGAKSGAFELSLHDRQIAYPVHIYRAGYKKFFRRAAN